MLEASGTLDIEVPENYMVMVIEIFISLLLGKHDAISQTFVGLYTRHWC